MQTYNHVHGTLDVEPKSSMVEAVELALVQAYIHKTTTSLMGHFLNESDVWRLREKIQKDIKLLRGEGLKEKEVLNAKLMHMVNQSLSMRS